MLQKIIIPTEMSEAAFDLIEHAKEMKAFGTSEILLVHCIESCDASPISQEYLNKVVQSNLDRQKSILQEAGFNVETLLAEGPAQDAIDRIACSENASLILTGAQKHALGRELFFGGLAYDIIHHARRPVLIIRLNENAGQVPADHRPAAAGLARHILHPTDFSDNAARAFDYLKRFVAGGADKITLLHVQDAALSSHGTPEQFAAHEANDRIRLDAMRDALYASGCRQVNTVLARGVPTDEILERIRTDAASLVLLGSQGTGRVRELFIGSVSQHVARHADVSVMLIPATRD